MEGRGDDLIEAGKSTLMMRLIDFALHVLQGKIVYYVGILGSSISVLEIRNLQVLVGLLAH